MRRFFLLCLLLFISYKSWPFLETQFEDSQYGTVITKIKSEINGINDNQEYSAVIESLINGIHQLLVLLDNVIEKDDSKENQTEENQVEKPVLETPADQTFSVFNIELGDTKDDVEKAAGVEKRSSFNEYGIKWFTYHENYQNFFMVAYDEKNEVVGLYTNQNLISSTNGIQRGSTKDLVREKLGEPLSRIEKGNVYYQFEENQDYDVYFKDASYVTIFYDKHQGNTVTSIQLINEKIEQNKQDFYADASPQMMEGFEYQLFDLTNATRVNHGLNILTWNDHVRVTAREHSSDMAENQYFDHTNLKGQSPFDRMQEDNVVFTFAGENLAYGQFSSIFAHEGLMNSLGHRENILRDEYEFLGVGVAFNDKSQPYYTENFFAD